MFKGTIYLLLEKSRAKDTPDDLSAHTYAGHYFETLCCKKFDAKEKSTGRNLLKPTTSGVKDCETSCRATTADEDAEFKNFKDYVSSDLCLIFRNRLSKHSLLYSAKSDCFEKHLSVDDVPLQSDEIHGIELKTSKKIAIGTKQEINLKKFKTLKWWAQSVLPNTKKVAVGYWDEVDIVVKQITEYTLDNLVSIGSPYWSPKICFYQLDKILSFMKESFKNSGQTKLRFEFVAYSKKITCRSSSLQVVPDFFRKEFD